MLSTEISHGRSWWGQRCAAVRALPQRGSHCQPPAEPAQDAASSTMLSSTWERTSHLRLVGQRPLLISSMDDSPSSDSQQSWQPGKLPHPFLPLFHLPCCGSKPISLPINIRANTPLGRELRAGFSSVHGRRGRTGGNVWEGARGCRSGLIWPGILAEFSRTVCTVSSPYNGYV